MGRRSNKAPQGVKPPATVEEMLEWKSLSGAGKIAKGWPVSVEKKNKKLTNGTNGIYKDYELDVLYSFLGIYAIGVWAYNNGKIDKNNKKMLTHTNYHIQLHSGGKSLKLWTTKILIELQNNSHGLDVEKLNNYLEGKDSEWKYSNGNFIEKYFCVGNVIPTWPGGNKAKGGFNNGFMDIPELFFKKNEYWFDALSKRDKAFLVDINKAITEPDSELFNSLGAFLESVNTPEKYKEYIDDAVKVINKRTEAIEKAFPKVKKAEN